MFLVVVVFQKKPTEVDDNMEEDWDLIPEFTLKSVVLIHNQLFGSRDLVEQVRSIHSFLVLKYATKYLLKNKDDDILMKMHFKLTMTFLRS